ncbi:MAG: squalene/phytoene synthase family protein, partial [Verrucomicrobiae bacterium]|nr:squalene/phytoene synthase family protein [Verrucomicrobiae bacterium]
MSLPAQLNELLRQVSRSFYLTMRVLPRPVRAPIGLAYLLARTSDTIADTPLIPAGERIRALDEFRRSICSGTGLAGFGRFALSTHVEETDQRLGIERLNPERALLIMCAEFVEALAMLPEPERNLVREVLDTIISGQKLDLQKFAEASVEHVIALESDRELDDYTYRVAGLSL